MRNHKLKSILIFIIAVTCGTIAYFQTPHSFTTRKVPTIDPNQKYLIQKVLDGDTFVIKIGAGTETVRMLGMDTPETVDPRKPVQCYGKEASDKTKELLTGHSVRLETDPTQDVLDKYGRILAYVYLGDIFINEYLLQNGFAREYTFKKPYQRQKEFKKIEKQAQKEKLGLWKACPN